MFNYITSPRISKAPAAVGSLDRDTVLMLSTLNLVKLGLNTCAWFCSTCSALVDRCDTGVPVRVMPSLKVHVEGGLSGSSSYLK